MSAYKKTLKALKSYGLNYSVKIVKDQKRDGNIFTLKWLELELYPAAKIEYRFDSLGDYIGIQIIQDGKILLYHGK